MCVARPWLPPPLDTVDTADTVDTGQGDDGHGWNVWGNVPRVVQLRVTSRVLPHSGVAQPSPALSSNTACTTPGLNTGTGALARYLHIWTIIEIWATETDRH